MKMAQTKQNGAALVIGLIMLLVMTLIGVTTMSTTRTELKISTNFKNHSNAFQTAAVMFERALTDPLINWLDASKTPLRGSYSTGYESSDKLKKGTLDVVFSGCRPAAKSSLTGNAGKMLVHQVLVTGNELNAGGDIVGVSRQISGYTTTAAGCLD